MPSLYSPAHRCVVGLAMNQSEGRPSRREAERASLRAALASRAFWAEGEISRACGGGDSRPGDREYRCRGGDARPEELGLRPEEPGLSTENTPGPAAWSRGCRPAEPRVKLPVGELRGKVGIASPSAEAQCGCPRTYTPHAARGLPRQNA